MVIVMKCYDQKPLGLIGRNQTHGCRKSSILNFDKDLQDILRPELSLRVVLRDAGYC